MRSHRVSAREMKRNFSRLLRAVENGSEVVVVRAGRPVARIVPANEAAPHPTSSCGMFAGQFTVADDFDDDANEFADSFGISTPT